MPLSSDYIPMVGSLKHCVEACFPQPSRSDQEESATGAELLRCLAEIADAEAGLVEAVETALARQQHSRVLTPEHYAILAWIEASFEHWQSNFPLEEPLLKHVRRLRALAAAQALEDPRFFTPGTHALHTLLDNLQQGAVGWQARLGDAGKILEWRFDRTVAGSLRWFTERSTDLARIAAEVASANQRERARAGRLIDRLLQSALAERELVQAQQIAARTINRYLSRHRLPEFIGEFLTGAWCESAAIVIQRFGAGSGEWHRMQRIMALLVDSLQPVGEAAGRTRAQLEKGSALLARELRRWLLSLENNADELDNVIGLIEYTQLRLINGQPLELIDIPQTPVDGEASVEESTQCDWDTGQWFLFYEVSEELRAQLVLQQESTGRLVFVNFSGIQVEEMSPERFRERLDSGLIEPLAHAATFSLSLAAAAGIDSEDQLYKLIAPAMPPDDRSVEREPSLEADVSGGPGQEEPAPGEPHSRLDGQELEATSEVDEPAAEQFAAADDDRVDGSGDAGDAALYPESDTPAVAEQPEAGGDVDIADEQGEEPEPPAEDSSSEVAGLAARSEPDESSQEDDTAAEGDEVDIPSEKSEAEPAAETDAPAEAQEHRASPEGAIAQEQDGQEEPVDAPEPWSSTLKRGFGLLRPLAAAGDRNTPEKDARVDSPPAADPPAADAGSRPEQDVQAFVPDRASSGEEDAQQTSEPGNPAYEDAKRPLASEESPDEGEHGVTSEADFTELREPDESVPAELGTHSEDDGSAAASEPAEPSEQHTAAADEDAVEEPAEESEAERDAVSGAPSIESRHEARTGGAIAEEPEEEPELPAAESASENEGSEVGSELGEPSVEDAAADEGVEDSRGERDAALDPEPAQPPEGEAPETGPQAETAQDEGEAQEPAETDAVPEVDGPEAASEPHEPAEADGAAADEVESSRGESEATLDPEPDEPPEGEAPETVPQAETARDEGEAQEPVEADAAPEVDGPEAHSESDEAAVEYAGAADAVAGSPEAGDAALGSQPEEPAEAEQPETLSEAEAAREGEEYPEPVEADAALDAKESEAAPELYEPSEEDGAAGDEDAIGDFAEESAAVESTPHEEQPLVESRSAAEPDARQFIADTDLCFAEEGTEPIAGLEDQPGEDAHRPREPAELFEEEACEVTPETDGIVERLEDESLPAQPQDHAGDHEMEATAEPPASSEEGASDPVSDIPEVSPRDSEAEPDLDTADLKMELIPEYRPGRESRRKTLDPSELELEIIPDATRERKPTWKRLDPKLLEMEIIPEYKPHQQDKPERTAPKKIRWEVIKDVKPGEEAQSDSKESRDKNPRGE